MSHSVVSSNQVLPKIVGAIPLKKLVRFCGWVALSDPHAWECMAKILWVGGPKNLAILGGGWSEKIEILGVDGPKKRLRTLPPLME